MAAGRCRHCGGGTRWRGTGRRGVAAAAGKDEHDCQCRNDSDAAAEQGQQHSAPFARRLTCAGSGGDGFGWYRGDDRGSGRFGWQHRGCAERGRWAARCGRGADRGSCATHCGSCATSCGRRAARFDRWAADCGRWGSHGGARAAEGTIGRFRRWGRGGMFGRHVGFGDQCSGGDRPGHQRLGPGPQPASDGLFGGRLVVGQRLPRGAGRG